VYDTQTGLRGFDRQCMEKFMNVEGDRYEYEMNMLLKAAEDDIPVHEVTIKTVYLEENKSSHFNAFKDSFRIYKSILKFAASSFIAFLIEYVVFLVLHGFLAKEIANVIARAVSSMVNFYVNHEIVFKSKEKLWKAAIKYFSLVAVMLVFDTLVLKFFMEVCHIPGWLAKPMTMTLIFFLNYPIQRKFVYKRQDRQKNG
ncbi:MAG: GtrA family protein, partial [Clostridia bacterium]|nr:GtrA family protein [Clostridia bacterium]